jgi:gliding motility-associated-like protein
MRSLQSLINVLAALFFCLLYLTESSIAQTVNSSGTVKSNFGIDADLYTDFLQFSSGTPDGTADFFKNDSLTSGGSGEAMIDTTGMRNFRNTIVAAGSISGRNIKKLNGMSGTKNSIINGRIVYDALFARDLFGINPTRDTSAMNGNYKNGSSPTTWVTGPVTLSNEDDLVDVGAVLRRQGPTHNDSLWFIGATTRIKTNEYKHYVDFELFSSAATFTPGSGITNTGTNNGHTAWTFAADGTPVTFGDVIFSFNSSDNGNTWDMTTRIWVNQSALPGGSFASFNGLANRPFTFTGVNTIGTGASPFGYAEITPRYSSNAAFARMNVSAATLAAPWGSLQGGSATYSNTILIRQLSEVAINLTALGLDKAKYNSSCYGFFGALLVKSRDGNSFDANIKDFAGPYPFGNVNVFHINANGGRIACNTGNATLSVTSGTTIQTYSWTGPGGFVSSLASPTATVGGTYFLRTTAAGGCSAVDTAIVAGTPQINISLTNSTKTCQGQSTGSLTVSASGGTGPYTYSWQGGGTGATRTGLAGGNYTVTATDANGCTGTNTFSVENHPGLLINLRTTNVFCQNICAGMIDLTIISGTSPFTYLWSNGATTQDLSNLCLGNYRVTVTDANGCQTISSALITNFSTLAVTVETRDVTYQSTNGQAHAQASGGTPPYTYLWSNGATTASITGLAPGVYGLTVTDNANNQVSEAAVVESAGLVKSGSFIVNMGVTPQTFANGLRPYGMIFDLVRNHNVPVKWVIRPGKQFDPLNGIVEKDFTYNGVDYKGGPFIIDAEFRTAAVNARIAYWQSQGVVGVTTTSDIEVPVYDIITTFGNVVIDQQNEGLVIPYFQHAMIPDSIYKVGLPSSLGPCDDSYFMPHADPTWATHSNLRTFNINERGFIWGGCHAPSVLEGIFNPSNPSQRMNFLSTTGLQCFGGGKCGNIAETHGGPTQPYKYRASAGKDPVMQFLDNMTPSTENGSEQWYIPVTTGRWNPGATNAVYTSDGAFPREGTKLVYGYGFDNPNNGLVMYEGGHTFNGKGTIQSEVSAERAFLNFLFNSGIEKRLNLNPNIAQSFISGVPTTVSVNVTNGSAPYSYQWSTSCGSGSSFSNPQSASPTFTLGNLPPQSTCIITCVVTDACGRRNFVSVSIASGTPPPNPVLISINSTQSAKCFGACDGSINVTVSGGFTPYRYTWSNGATTQNLSNLCAGAYSITVRDSIGCEKSDTIIISQPSVLSATVASTTNVTCNGQNNGAINLSVSGGTPGYTYLWSNGSTLQNISSLGAGNYSVTVKDANNCQVILSNILVTQPNVLAASVNILTNVSCQGGSDGSITLNVTGGTTPYTYAWSNTQTTSSISGLSAGTYSVTVRDANNCSATVTGITVSQPALLTATVASKTNVSCNGGNNGAINVTVAGGTTPYTYNWSNGATTKDLTGLTAGSYTLVVTDAKGCTSTTGAVIITEPNTLTATVNTITTVRCNGELNGSITLNVSQGTPPYTYFWSNNSTAASLTGVGAGTYSVTVSDANFCQRVLTGLTITQPAVLTASLTSKQNEICNNSATGSIDVTISGGNVPFTYLWSNGATTEDLTNINGGTYSITVTDFKGCKATLGNIIVTTVNCPPTAVNDTVSTNEDTPKVILVLNNDSDPDGALNITSLQIVTSPLHGTVVVNPGGTVTYSPATNYYGPDQFTYIICDNGVPSPVLCDTALVVINVVSVNDPPIALNDNIGTPENTPVNIPVLSNDSDPDGALNPSTLVIISGPNHGNAVVNNGTIDYTPNNGYNGNDTLFYRICDNGVPAPVLCDTARVIINVNSVNDPPIAVDDNATTNEDTPVNIPVLNNDSDPDGLINPATLAVIVNPLHGNVVINPNGTITYTPAPNYYGNDTLTYRICDDGVPLPVLCDTARVFIVVVPVNDPPIALPDNATTNEDTPVTISVLNNDSDPDGLIVPSTVVVTSNPSNGTVSVNPITGQITYTPNPDYNGPDSFIYRVCDNGVPSPQLCDTAIVNINVISVNDPPIAVNDTTSTNEDTPKTIVVLSNDSDPDGAINPNTVVVVSNPSNGSVVVNPNGTITYTPNPNFFGNDAFTYSVCDNGVPAPVLCDTATVFITINAVNDPPIAVQDNATTNEDTPVTIPILNNDTDPDGSINTGSVTITLNPSHGTVVVNPGGTITYTPNPNYYGGDTLIYNVCDNGVPSPVLCDTAIVFINVVPVNDPPIALNDTATTREDTPKMINVLNNDSDPDGALVVGSVVITMPPGHGSAVVNPNGTITYTPSPNYYGNDTLKYRVCDNGVPAPVLCDTAFVFITVTPVNDPPIANDDFANTNEDTPVTIPVLANDTDPDGAINPTTVFIIRNPNHGTAIVNANGTVTYTPNANYYGSDSLVYRVCDNGVPSPVLCDTAVVYINVIPVNDPPIANTDIVTTPEDTPITVSVLNNDSDPDGAIVISTLTVTSPPSNGSYTINTNTGTITYIPNLNFYGTDTLIYQICDNGVPSPVLCDTAFLIITVTPVNDPPVAVRDDASTAENTPITIPILNNDYDVDGVIVPSTVNVTLLPKHGTVVINPGGTITYTPNAGYNGLDTLIYRVCDNGTPPPTLCDTAIVIINVIPVNDPPIAVDDFETTPEDTPIMINVPGNDSDPDGSLNLGSVVVFSSPSHGTTTVNPTTGVITYTPAPNYFGPDTFYYRICDNGVPLPVLCDTARVVIIVTPVNDPPVAVTDNVSTNEDTPVTIPVTNNDYDVDGVIVPSTVTITSSPTHGTVVNNGNGTITYTPNANYNGPDSFIYSVCDNGLPVLCDTAFVFINVNPINDPPIAVNDIRGTGQGVPIDVDVKLNDSDVDGNIVPSSVTIVTPPNNGTASVNPSTGVITYTPNPSFIGTDTLRYSICDDGTPLPSKCATALVIINVANGPTITAIVDSVSCNGLANGSIDVTVLTGANPFTYIWSPNGQTTQDISGLSPGSYTVTVTDNNGSTVSQTFTIYQPAVLSLSGSTTSNALCNGQANGNINLNVSGGTAPYTYTWSNSATTQNLNNIAAGTYSVTVRDAKNCSVTSTFNITQPQPLSGSVTIIPVQCAGDRTGAIDLTLTGGTSPYTIRWSTGATTEDIINLEQGQYQVYVSDANGCLFQANYTVIELSRMVISVGVTNVSCGRNDGQINLSVAGGFAPYTYSWSNGATTSNNINLTSGTYTVTVTDSRGCTATKLIPVDDVQPLIISTSVTSEICGGANGTINITVSQGFSPYTYAWSNSATTRNISNLTAGTYQVTVTDSKGCIDVAVITVNGTSNIVIIPTVSNASCGLNNGSILVTVAGGSGQYTYLWSNGAAADNINNIPSGVYSITVTDANGCSATRNINVGNATAATLTGVVQNTTCGQNNGSISINVTGGVGPFVYSWSSGATTQNISGLGVGVFTVEVKDSRGCVSIGTFNVSSASGIFVEADKKNVSCYALRDGSVKLTVTGGTGNYTYLWSDGATTKDVSNLGGSNYSVTVTDANGCTASTTVNIVEPQQINIPAQIIDVTCSGSTTGAINISVTGGISPFQFDWSNGATTEDISGVTNGFYQVFVRDSNNCTAQASFTISATSNMILSTGVTNATCGQNNAEATVSAAGGVGPYRYRWSNNALTQTVAGLSPDLYTVTVTDALGCTASVPVLVDFVNEIQISYVVTDVICGVQPTGSIDLTVTGGTAPYSYLWSNGALVDDLNFIAPGDYCVTVTDQTGCSSALCVTVADIPSMVLAITRVDADCSVSNGTASVSVIGGTPGYSYLWSTGENTATIDSLAAGTYYVTVEDINGCTVSSLVNLQNFSAPLLSLNIINATCGNNNGSISSTVSGSIPPYRFKWSNGATTSNISSLAPGFYGVTVTDSVGCSAVQTATILPSRRIIMVADRYNVTCNGLQNGSIDVSVAGGQGTYSYLWSNGFTTQDISNLPAGVYSVTVADAGGCTATTSIPISQPQQLTISTQVEPVLCAGGNNGGLTISITGGNPSYDILWSTGATTPSISGLVQGIYSVSVTDSLGCSARHSATVSTQYNLIVSSAVTNATCGLNNGSIYISVTGGSGNYTYQWNSSALGTLIDSLNAGTYTVTVNDAAGCSVARNVVVSNTSGLNVNVTVTNAQCSNLNTGVLSASVSGGQTPYTYNWSNGSTNANISALPPGIYYLTVTDATGCRDISQHTVDLRGNLQLTMTTTPANCQSNNGTATVIVGGSGGTAPYTYSWSTNAQNSSTATGFGPGIYSVTVTDALGCSSTQTFTVSGISSPIISVNVMNNNCANGSVGAVDITLQGGIAPIRYIWSNGATTEDISGLLNGTYSVTVTDSSNCPVVAVGTVTSPNALIVKADVYPVVCNGDSTGSLDVTVNAGSAPYTYLWSTGATTQDISGIPVGNYQITVIDQNGCSVNTSANISQPNAIVGTVDSITPASCYSGADGDVYITVLGGVGPYSYNWSNGATTQNLMNAPAGSYTLVITDSRNCISDSLSVTITEPLQITITLGELYDASCNGIADGSISVVVSGGIQPYSFNWSNSATSQNINGLPAGIYSLTVIDGNGCSSTAFTDTVSQPDAITISSNQITPVSCSGSSTGAIDISVSGGTSPYSYEWSPGGQTTQDITGLATGTYSVTVFDVNECSATNSFVVDGAGPIDLSGTILRNPTCIDFTDGSITVIANGGNSNFTYQWSDTNFTGANRINLPVGTYRVTVTDGSNCSVAASFTLSGAICNLPPVANNDTVQTYTGGTIKIPVLNNDYDPDGDTISVTGIVSEPNHGTVIINSDGTITYVSDSGYIGIDSFSYVICDNGFPQLCDTATVYVTVLPNKPNVFIPNGFSPNGDPYNEYWEVVDITKYPKSEVEIFNRWGNKVYESAPYQNEWNGLNLKGEPLPDGTYFYILKLNDDKDTSFSGFVVINRGQ